MGNLLIEDYTAAEGFTGGTFTLHDARRGKRMTVGSRQLLRLHHAAELNGLLPTGMRRHRLHELREHLPIFSPDASAADLEDAA